MLRSKAFSILVFTAVQGYFKNLPVLMDKPKISHQKALKFPIKFNIVFTINIVNSMIFSISAVIYIALGMSL